MISTHLSSTVGISNTNIAVSNATSLTHKTIEPTESESPGIGSGGTTFSSIGKQLNESAARAASRDNRLSAKELTAFAKTVVDKLTDSSYHRNKALHDAETPDTQDPGLLDRARQATRFTNGQGSNPFAGFSQDTLRLIAYDESGDFTLNERKAAYKENYYQQEAWNREMCQRYVDEYNETGKSTQTLFMILEHYNALPPIEKAQYPAGYVANLTSGDSSVLDLFNSLNSRPSADQLPSPST